MQNNYISAIPTISLVTDLKRMGRMSANGPRARVIDTLCDAIEKELVLRIKRAVISVNTPRFSLDNTEMRRESVVEWSPRGLTYELESRTALVWKGDRWQEPTIMNAIVSPLFSREEVK